MIAPPIERVTSCPKDAAREYEREQDFQLELDYEL